MFGILARAREIAAVLLVPEKPVLRRLQLLGQLEPLHVERSLIKIEQPLNVKRVVLRKPADLARAVAIAAQQAYASSRRKVCPCTNSAARVAASR